MDANNNGACRSGCRWIKYQEGRPLGASGSQPDALPLPLVLKGSVQWKVRGRGTGGLEGTALSRSVSVCMRCETTTSCGEAMSHIVS